MILYQVKNMTDSAPSQQQSAIQLQPSTIQPPLNRITQSHGNTTQQPIPLKAKPPLHANNFSIRDYFKNPQLFYGVGGILIGIISVTIILTIIKFSSPPSANTQSDALSTISETKPNITKSEPEINDNNEKEQKETEAKTAAEKAEKERKETEAKAKAKAKAKAEKAIFENARKETDLEQNVANVKINDEKTELKRLESQKPLTPQETNNQHTISTKIKNVTTNSEPRQKIANQNLVPESGINQQLAHLPVYWEIGLPVPQTKIIHLNDSKFLWEFKERIRINYIPFVDLNRMSVNNREITIQTKKEKHKIEFYRTIKENSTANPSKPLLILTIELTPDGLSCNWIDILREKHLINDEMRRCMNRIILAKLQIEIVGIHTKEIALLAPTNVSSVDIKNFVLWQKDIKQKVNENQSHDFLINNETKPESKEYAILDKESLLLDFDEYIIENKSHKLNIKNISKLPSSNEYSPTINYGDIIGKLKITIHGKHNLKIEPIFEQIQYKQETILNSIHETSKENEWLEKRLNEIATESTKAKNLLKDITVTNLSEDKLQKIRLESRLKDLERQSTLLKQKINNNKQEITTLNNAWLKLETTKKEINKGWNNIDLKTFRIYLVKPTLATSFSTSTRSYRTNENTIDKPENLLLLFEVNP
jgi:hypothetical protein